jgi:hypothetical protein
MFPKVLVRDLKLDFNKDLPLKFPAYEQAIAPVCKPFSFSTNLKKLRFSPRKGIVFYLILLHHPRISGLSPP